MGWSSFHTLTWQAAPMPYSSGPVSLARLPSGNDDFLAFVRFPPGWSRSQPVVYEAAEEFVILEGELRSMIGAGWPPPTAVSKRDRSEA